MRVINWLFWQFQKRCIHDPNDVAYDILEGSGREFVEVAWCHRCGAYVINHHPASPLTTFGLKHGMRTPRATWTGTGEMTTA
jgi:hypothetical protein